MLAERDTTDGNITLMPEERKQMETRVSPHRNVIAAKKKALKKIKSEKKLYLQVTNENQNILLQQKKFRKRMQ